MNPEYGILLYDGVCGFCDRLVQWLLEHDTDGWLRYAPLQGETAAALRERHSEIPESLDTMVYVECGGGEERVYTRSDAAFRVASRLGVPWRWMAVFRCLPRALTDALYLAIVKSRYRIFGQLEACRVPTGPEQSRFLA